MFVFLSADIVYVYCNKSSEIVHREFQQALNETQSLSSRKAGFQRSPPRKTANEDMDTMALSVQMAAHHAQNLGTIYILVSHAEEVNDERVTSLPNVKVVTSASLGDGGIDVQFSSLKSESSIHRIPNLSTLYLAMNDDMIFTRDVELKSFFFTPNGSPRAFTGVDPRIESWKHLVQRLISRKSGSGQLGNMKYTLNRLDSIAKGVQNKSRERGGKQQQQEPGGGLRLWQSRNKWPKLYPTHAPRPFNKRFVNLVETLDPDLLQTPFQTRFKCQGCLSPNVLSLLHSAEAGTLRTNQNSIFSFWNHESYDGDESQLQYTLLAYIDSKRTWNKVVEQWDSITFLTLQEVEPEWQSTVRSFIEDEKLPRDGNQGEKTTLASIALNRRESQNSVITSQ